MVYNARAHTHARTLNRMPLVGLESGMIFFFFYFIFLACNYSIFIRRQECAHPHTRVHVRSTYILLYAWQNILYYWLLKVLDNSKFLFGVSEREIISSKSCIEHGPYTWRLTGRKSSTTRVFLIFDFLIYFSLFYRISQLIYWNILECFIHSEFSRVQHVYREWVCLFAGLTRISHYFHTTIIW